MASRQPSQGPLRSATEITGKWDSSQINEQTPKTRGSQTSPSLVLDYYAQPLFPETFIWKCLFHLKSKVKT